MNPISINSNQSFCARIKINKEMNADLAYSSVMSSIGTSSTGSGILSSLPAFDPAHHIHPMAMSVDMTSSLSGSALTGYGAYNVKNAASALYKSIKNTYIPD